MGLETGAYVGDLNVANPSGADPKSQGDDHIRLIKAAARNSFPGFAGVVAGTGVESGSGDAYAVALTPAPAAYAGGMLVVFKATHTNSGAATLQLGALAAKALKAVDGSALEAGDIESGAVVGAFYDGTDFMLVTANDRVARGGDTMTGAHDFTGATVRVETLGGTEDSTKVASTAWVRGLFGKIAGQVWAGVQDLTGATTKVATAAPGTNDTTAASTAFVQQQAFAAVLPVQAGNGGKVLGTDGIAAAWVISPGAPDVIIQDQKPSGSGPGTLPSNMWVTRTLNTVVHNVDPSASLDSNNLTIGPGSYIIRASAALSSASSTLNQPRAKVRIFNVTDDVAISPSGIAVVATASEWTNAGDGSVTTNIGSSIASVEVALNLASPKALRIEMYIKGGGGGGVPVSAGDAEVYASMEAIKLS